MTKPGETPMPSVLVRFDAELRLVDDEVPETLDYATVQQAVQDSIGYTGTVVLDVTQYEHQSSDSRSGDRWERDEARQQAYGEFEAMRISAEVAEARLAKVPALVEALRAIAGNRVDDSITHHQNRKKARDALAVWEQE